MKKIALAVATVLAGGVMSNVALADTYIGGKLGYNALNDACHLDAPCDDDSFAAGMHLGYNFNEYVAAEYGVDYLGNFTANFNKAGKNTVDGDLWALTLAPKFNLPLTDSWNLFAIVGAAYMMAGDEKDFVPTGSLGAEYQINYNWSLRAEYQRYQDMSDDIIDDMDSDFFGIGFNYKFGSEPVVQEEVVETRPVTRIVEHEYPAQTATVQFGLESAELQDASAFNGTVELMNTYPQAQVEINGYSDTTGSEAYNQQLTEKRAQAVADHFQAEGIAADRMTVKGMGEANPVASNETREGREQNRRVEVVVPAFQYQTTEEAK
ncbi:Outer membrane protein A precursor [Vibrio harveyi]|uniref:OmpA family protein n=1 Tax=Vibrio harveyi TaxID=669 RepID=UPI001EFDE90A|nr:OmpA family protein [Vibrio harveyi]MCG9236124.1 outer membrane beta-barrel protein [Vibrio harveyi]MCG9588809.1 outer membrane beta-barrel protein [Vibrio harveyi]CAH1231264.1 Outer membrane protein A precursor [Vibrio harveyi]CAH1551098.1 Outer membrane protein A precursor [Vibrio harveyi]CAH1555252.1 Outer membrane protein A precursor [Vibrio harveyi]